MKIKVGDLAKIYDLSNQSLHYYENKKLISSYRDVINNYRYYDSADLSKLGTIKKYRNAKFHIDTITHVMKDVNNVDEVSNLYNEQIEILKEEIRHDYDIINVLHELNEKISHCKENRIQIEDLDFYRVDAGETQIIFQNNRNKQFFQSWFKNILFTNSSYQLFCHDHSLQRLHYGMACDCRYSSYIETENDKVIRHQGKYLCGYFIDMSNSTQLHTQIQTLKTYAKEHQISLKDECFCEIIQSISGVKEPFRYSRIIIKITC